jgi:hypothetical protein
VGVGAILTLLLLPAADPGPPAAGVPDLLDEARAAFQQGLDLRKNGENGRKQFRIAADNYEKSRRLGVDNPELFGNLGNAYVLADDLPHAILAYRRGLRLDPNDAGLRERLTAARAMVVYNVGDPLGRIPPETRPWWLPRVAPTWLLFVGLLCYTGMFATITRWAMTRRGRWLAVAAACLIVSAGATVLLLDAERRRAAGAGETLVVIKDDDVLLRKGDGLKYPKRYETTVNRGVEARLLAERQEGRWVQIELAGGEVGWVPREFVLIDRGGAD